jgi:hypothetical protein
MEQIGVPVPPDYAGAIDYALQRLRTEFSPLLTYHTHTERDVMPAAVRLARLCGLPEADIRLLEVAAAYHDIGQIKTSLGHEPGSICPVKKPTGNQWVDIGSLTKPHSRFVLASSSTTCA